MSQAPGVAGTRPAPYQPADEPTRVTPAPGPAPYQPVDEPTRVTPPAGRRTRAQRRQAEEAAAAASHGLPNLDEPADGGWSRMDEPMPGSGPGRSDADTPFRRRKGGAGKRKGAMAAAVLAAAAAVAVLLIGGYWFWGGTAIPGTQQKYLAGVSVTEVTNQVDAEGLSCVRGRKIVQCSDEKSIKGAELSVTVHFDSETEVTKLEASGGTEAYSNDEASPEELQSFFEMAAALPLGTDSGDASEAKTWASENVGKADRQTIGGVVYEASEGSSLLTMTPA
ncbi:MAG: hypothetical protein ACRDTQ_17345 [Micromonosporaceae bacterium]